jgi:hypothetical protein
MKNALLDRDLRIKIEKVIKKNNKIEKFRKFKNVEKVIDDAKILEKSFSSEKIVLITFANYREQTSSFDEYSLDNF